MALSRECSCVTKCHALLDTTSDTCRDQLSNSGLIDLRGLDGLLVKSGVNIKEISNVLRVAMLENVKAEAESAPCVSVDNRMTALQRQPKLLQACGY